MQKSFFLKFSLSLILAQCLLLAPTQSAWACSYPDDEALAKQQTECQKNPSMQWDCKLNRCITPQTVVDMRVKNQACIDLPETTKEELAAKKACMDQRAESETGVKGGQTPKGSGFMVKAAYTMSVGLALINSFSTMAEGDSCTSKTIFNATAYGAIAGELYQYFFLKKSLEKLQKNYKDGIIKEGAAFEAQVKAFEYLRDEQDAIADIAKKKQILYTTLAAGYGAATAVALVEISTLMTKCKGYNSAPLENNKKPFTGSFSYVDWNLNNKSIATAQIINSDSALNALFNFKEQMDFLEGKNSFSPEIQAYNELKKQNLVQTEDKNTFKEVLRLAVNSAFPEAKAEGMFSGASEFLSALFGKDATGAAEKSGVKDYLNKLGSSEGIAVVSAVCSGLSFKLASESAKEKKNALERKKMIEEIIAKFRADMAQFCTEKDRQDINKPECFCYTAKFEKSADRVNSETCKKYWDWKGHNYFKAAGNYDPAAVPSQGCIDMSKNLDRNCSCKNTVNSKTGVNNCLKSNLSKIDLGNLGAVTGLSNTGTQLDSIYQGNLGSGSVDSDTIGKNAANTQKVIDSLLKQAESKNIKMPPVKDEKYLNALTAQLTPKSVLDAAKGSILASNANPSSLRQDLPGIEEALKKSGLSSSDYEGGTGKGKKAGADSFSIPSFGNQGSSDSSGQGKVVEGFMNQEREFKDEDIVKDDGVPIWSILSKRYMTSGYRRLFDEATPPAAATPATKEAVKQ